MLDLFSLFGIYCWILYFVIIKFMSQRPRTNLTNNNNNKERERMIKEKNIKPKLEFINIISDCQAGGGESYSYER